MVMVHIDPILSVKGRACEERGISLAHMNKNDLRAPFTYCPSTLHWFNLQCYFDLDSYELWYMF
jgi:hypothetical protein